MDMAASKTPSRYGSAITSAACASRPCCSAGDAPQLNRKIATNGVVAKALAMRRDLAVAAAEVGDERARRQRGDKVGDLRPSLVACAVPLRATAS